MTGNRLSKHSDFKSTSLPEAQGHFSARLLQSIRLRERERAGQGLILILQR